MNDLLMKISFGNDGVYIPFVGENDLFVPWTVVSRTEQVMLESRKKMSTIPLSVGFLLSKIMKRIPIKLSAINTIIETACCIKQIGGRLIWKAVEYEKAIKNNKHIR